MERLQLNIRLDGKRDLLEAIKTAAENNNESLNGYCVRILSESIGFTRDDTSNSASMGDVERLLDTKLAAMLDSFLDNQLDPKLDELLARLEALESAIATPTPTQEDKQPGKLKRAA